MTTFRIQSTLLLYFGTWAEFEKNFNNYIYVYPEQNLTFISQSQGSFSHIIYND